MQEVTTPASSPVPDAVEAPRKPSRSKRKSVAQEQSAPSPLEKTTEAEVSDARPAPTQVPTMVIQQLQQRLMNPDHSVHFQTRQKQLQTTLEIMSQIARKIGKEDANQRAVLSGMYELMLVIAERFVLLTHGIMQLDAMNHASALPAIREARRRYKQVADVQSNRQAQEHLDVPGTLQLLSELSRGSLD